MLFYTLIGQSLTGFTIPTQTGRPVCRSNKLYSARRFSSGSLKIIRTGIERSDWVLWLEVAHQVDVSPNPILILDLAGNGELVILFRERLPFFSPFYRY
jgi:hypothetical protein